MTDLDKLVDAGLEKGFAEQVAKLFGVLMAASEEDRASGAAMERFRAGMVKAWDLYDECLVAVAEILAEDEG